MDAKINWTLNVPNESLIPATREGGRFLLACGSRPFFFGRGFWYRSMHGCVWVGGCT